MRSVEPNLGTRETNLAVGQPQYESLLVAEFFDTNLHSPVRFARYKLSEQEREEIAAGADLYIGQATFGRSYAPMMPQIGNFGLDAKPGGILYRNLRSIK